MNLRWLFGGRKSAVEDLLANIPPEPASPPLPAGEVKPRPKPTLIAAIEVGGTRIPFEMTGQEVHINPSPGQKAIRREARIRALIQAICPPPGQEPIPKHIILAEHLPELEQLAWTSADVLKVDFLKRVQEAAKLIRTELEKEG